MCLLNVMRHVPHGAVVFFPSYDYMALFEKALKEGSLFEKFQVGLMRQIGSFLLLF